MKASQLLRSFGQNNLFIEAEIRRVEEDFDVDLGHRRAPLKEDKEAFPQFKEQLRNEAARMSEHFVIFYCLENSIRELITARLSAEFGADWWEKGVIEAVKNEAKANQAREAKAGVTPRSSEPLDYTTFGQLWEIIQAQWLIFGDMFRDKSAVGKIFSSLNMLRGPIAHCKPLAEDEVLRLQLALRDWFRQMS
jgi:hypothetical protein